MTGAVLEVPRPSRAALELLDGADPPEHIFRKLGVETRTAAAVLALQALSSVGW